MVGTIWSGWKNAEINRGGQLFPEFFACQTAGLGAL
jgi:hypothetical protein